MSNSTCSGAHSRLRNRLRTCTKFFAIYVVGTIGGLKRCHGVAIVNDLGKGFITDGDLEKVVIFDIKTLKVIGEVKTNQPDNTTAP